MSDRKRKPDAEVYSIFKKKKIDPPANAQVLTDDPAAAEKLQAFQALLDFSAVTTGEEIAARFSDISRTLLHEMRMVVRREGKTDVELEILEAEFYLQIGDCHEDPFTHGSEEQKISGRWYFHRAPRVSRDSHRSATSLTEYRGGSRKGMDLTLGGPSGNPDPSSSGRLLRGGILLRSVRDVNGKVTSGPSLLVDLILKASGVSEIKDLINNKWNKDTSAFPSSGTERPFCLFLKPVAEKPKTTPTMYFSPRIGLDLSHPGTTSSSTLPLHPRIQFLPRKYRFFTHPELLVANGRAQTFLAVLDTLSAASAGQSGSRNTVSRDIARITGVKEATAAKYFADYNAGREGGVTVIDSFIGPKGKGASSSPATYLKMMGALSTMQGD